MKSMHILQWNVNLLLWEGWDKKGYVVVALSFNSNTWEAETSEFKASMLYRESSKTARAAEKPCLKQPNQTKPKSNTNQPKKMFAMRL